MQPGATTGPEARLDLRLVLPALARHSRVARLNQEPALGAVRLALAEMKGGAKLPVYTPNLT